MEKCQKDRRSATREQEVKFRPKSQGRIWPSEERGHSRPPHVGPGRILGGSSEGPGRVLGGEGRAEGRERGKEAVWHPSAVVSKR